MNNGQAYRPYDQFGIAQRDYARSKFEEFALQRGFIRKRKDFYTRPASDGITHAFVPGVSIHSQYKSLHFAPTFVICHRGIGDLVHAVLHADSNEQMLRAARPYKDWVTVGVVKFVLAFERGIGAIADYTVDHCERLDPTLSEALEDSARAMPLFLSRQENMQDLVNFIETTDWAGGTGRWVNLLAALFVAGRVHELKAWIESLKEQKVAPITTRMIDYISAQLGQTQDSLD